MSRALTGVNLDAPTTELCDRVGVQLSQRLGRPVRGRTETIRTALEELHQALGADNTKEVANHGGK